MKRLFAASAVIVVGLCVGSAMAQPPVPYGPVPEPRYEAVPPPRTGYYWAPGHWHWNGYRYVWFGGHWTAGGAPRGAWIPGHWQWNGYRHIWIAGHWG